MVKYGTYCTCSVFHSCVSLRISIIFFFRVSILIDPHRFLSKKQCHLELDFYQDFTYRSLIIFPDTFVGWLLIFFDEGLVGVFLHFIFDRTHCFRVFTRLFLFFFGLVPGLPISKPTLSNTYTYKRKYCFCHTYD